MKSDVGHHNTTHRDRLQPPYRRQLAGAADLNFDGLQRRFGAFGRKFMRNRPTRRFCDEAQPLMPIKPVDLIDDAIDIIRQVSTFLLNIAIMDECVLRPGNAGQHRRDRYTPI